MPLVDKLAQFANTCQMLPLRNQQIRAQLLVIFGAYLFHSRLGFESSKDAQIKALTPPKVPVPDFKEIRSLFRRCSVMSCFGGIGFYTAMKLNY